MKKFIKTMVRSLKKTYKPRQFWDRWVDTFMEDPWQVDIHEEHLWMLTMIKRDKPASILEVGCGFGRNIRFFIENGIAPEDLYGIDISEKMIKKAKTFISNRKVKLVVADVTSLPFENSRFDMVFTHGVLMHVEPYLIEKAIQEVFRVSRRYLMIVEQNYNGNYYTFVHDYKNLINKHGIIAAHIHNNKIGLDYLYVKVQK